MAKGVACGMCGMHVHGETDDELVQSFQKHVREAHGQEPPPREEILAHTHEH